MNHLFKIIHYHFPFFHNIVKNISINYSRNILSLKNPQNLDKIMLLDRHGQDVVSSYQPHKKLINLVMESQQNQVIRLFMSLVHLIYSTLDISTFWRRHENMETF